MWTETAPNNFSTEMSDLQGNAAITQTIVVAPNGTIPRNLFVAKRDAEGELTHWEANYCGNKYIIWND